MNKHRFYMLIAIMLAMVNVIELNMFLTYGDLFQFITTIAFSLLLIGFIAFMIKTLNIKSDDEIRNEYLKIKVKEYERMREEYRAICGILPIKQDNMKLNRLIQIKSNREYEREKKNI